MSGAPSGRDKFKMEQFVINILLLNFSYNCLPSTLKLYIVPNFHIDFNCSQSGFGLPKECEIRNLDIYDK